MDYTKHVYLSGGRRSDRKYIDRQ